MTPTPTLTQAARRLADILGRIADAATAFIASTAPTPPRAANSFARLLELCALLIARLATDPAPLSRAASEKDERDDAAEIGTETETETEDSEEHAENLERLESVDRPIRGDNRSTLALIVEIHRELDRVANILGLPIPEPLAALCREALAAAMQLEQAALAAEIATLNPPNPPTTLITPPPFPIPPPVTTLER